MEEEKNTLSSCKPHYELTYTKGLQINHLQVFFTGIH